MRLFLIASCASLALITAATAAGNPPVLHAIMKDIVAPGAQALWDIGNLGMDDDGKPDGSKLGTGEWAKLTAAAQTMKDAATLLAETPGMAVVAPGDKLQDEGAPGSVAAKDIQAFIAKDPQGFATHAKALAAVSDSYLAAAANRNVVLLQDAAGKLDEVCEACHMQYWYPEQK